MLFLTVATSLGIQFPAYERNRYTRFKRAVVPEDDVNMDINTLDFGDASPWMACIAIYARFLRKNGEYSCQLIFSRTRTVPKEYT